MNFGLQKRRTGRTLYTTHVLLAVVVWASALILVAAQPPLEGITHTWTTRHTGPGLDYPVIESLPQNTPITVTGCDVTLHWLYVEPGGWLPTGHVTLPQGSDLRALPVIETILPTPETATWREIPPPVESLTNDETLLEYLQQVRETPILFNMTTVAVRSIYLRGQAMGNRADVFSKVGDSNTANGDFMRPFGMAGNICDLGSYAYLQATIDHFSTPPRPGVRNSFDTLGFATQRAMSMVSILDPIWAIAPECEATESSLLCEYRMNRPSIAVIMLGRVDSEYGDADLFRASTTRVVQLSIEHGVIPVLTTFVMLPENIYWKNTLEYNAILVEIAQTYDIPLINLWAATQTLPQYGIGPDLSHLSHALGEFCNFTGSELRYGGTLRNLLSLQALDEIRRFVQAEG